MVNEVSSIGSELWKNRPWHLIAEEKGGAVANSIWTLNPTGRVQTALDHVASHSRVHADIRARRVVLLRNRPLRTCTVGRVGAGG